MKIKEYSYKMEFYICIKKQNDRGLIIEIPMGILCIITLIKLPSIRPNTKNKILSSNILS